MMVSKRNLLFQGAIFRFHVKLWEGMFHQIETHIFEFVKFWGLHQVSFLDFTGKVEGFLLTLT